MCEAQGTAKARVLLENDRVRVTEWRFGARGDNTGWHVHEHDDVVVPQFDGTLDIDLPEGETMIAQLKTGVPYFRGMGTEHDVKSGNDFECAFIEIELLEPRQTPSDPA